MGRTVHYKTKELISKEKFGRLQKLVEEINERETIRSERLKIWRSGKHLEGAQVWGFTKVQSQKKAELVIELIKEISSRVPETTWIVLDEGRTKPVKMRMKNGALLTLD